MMIRQLLGAAALFTALGIQPSAVHAAATPGPFRFAIVTAADHPEYIRIVGQRRQHVRRIGVRRRAVRSFTELMAKPPMPRTL